MENFFKKIDDNEIYTLLELLIPSLDYSKEVTVNNSKNIFLIKTDGNGDNIFNFEVFSRWDIVKKNKIEEIKNLVISLTFKIATDINCPIKHQILGKSNSEKLNNNKSEKNELIYNDLFSPYCPLFSFFKNVEKNMINYLAYEDLVFNLKEKKNIFHQTNKIKNNRCIILDNEYILLLLLDSAGSKVFLILIAPDNQYKPILTLDPKASRTNLFGPNEKVSTCNIYSVYKNYFMIVNYDYLYFYEFLEKCQDVQLVLCNLRKNLLIFESFEFSSHCCILNTNQGLLLYNWKKDEILRTLSLPVEQLQSNLIFINKTIFAGIFNNNFLIYNLIEDKLEKIRIPLNDKTLFYNIYNSQYFIFVTEKNEKCILRMKNFDKLSLNNIWSSFQSLNNDKKSEIKKFILSK